LAVNPGRLLVKLPVVPVSVVCNPVARGAVAVPWHTSLAVNAPPPSVSILPPETTVVRAIEKERLETIVNSLPLRYVFSFKNLSPYFR